ELTDPNRTGISLPPCAADVPVKTNGQQRIASDVADAALLASIGQLAGKVSAFEGLRVVALPHMPIAVRVAVEIERALVLTHGGKPRIVSPVGFHHDGIVRLVDAQEVINSISLAARVPACPNLRAFGADAGLRLKPPKTKQGKRNITLPSEA